MTLSFPHKKYLSEVNAWLRDEGQEITRGSVKRLREFLNEIHHRTGHKKGSRSPDSEKELDANVIDAAAHDIGDQSSKRMKKPILHVRHMQRSGRLLLHCLPPIDGHAWLMYDDNYAEVLARLSEIDLIALCEG